MRILEVVAKIAEIKDKKTLSCGCVGIPKLLTTHELVVEWVSECEKHKGKHLSTQETEKRYKELF